MDNNFVSYKLTSQIIGMDSVFGVSVMSYCQLETRHCPCGKEFRVLPTSAQVYHSRTCEAAPEPSVDEKRRSSMGASIKQGTVRKDGKVYMHGAWRTPEGAEKKLETDKLRSQDPEVKKNSASESVRNITATKKNTANENDSTISSIKNGLTHKVLIENEETEITQGRFGMNGTQKTEKRTTKQSEPEGASVTPHTGSTAQFLTSAMVESPSMNLLDSTAEHLSELMDSLRDSEDARPPQIHIEKIHAVCLAAKNIREIMKLKLDAMKLQHEINKATGKYERS